MADIRNVENAMMTGAERAKKIHDKWQQQYYQPVMDMQAQMFLKLLQGDPELLAQFKAQNPEAVRKFMQQFGGKNATG